MRVTTINTKSQKGEKMKHETQDSKLQITEALLSLIDQNIRYIIKGGWTVIIYLLILCYNIIFLSLILLIHFLILEINPL